MYCSCSLCSTASRKTMAKSQVMTVIWRAGAASKSRRQRRGIIACYLRGASANAVFWLQLHVFRGRIDLSALSQPRRSPVQRASIHDSSLRQHSPRLARRTCTARMMRPIPSTLFEPGATVERAAHAFHQKVLAAEGRRRAGRGPADGAFRRLGRPRLADPQDLRLLLERHQRAAGLRHEDGQRMERRRQPPVRSTRANGKNQYLPGRASAFIRINLDPEATKTCSSTRKATTNGDWSYLGRYSLNTELPGDDEPAGRGAPARRRTRYGRSMPSATSSATPWR